MSRKAGASQPEDYGELLRPEEAQEPILPKAVRAALTGWLTEIWAEQELRAVGVKPRLKAIFDGPPGVGKTTLAHHLAARLGLPMLAVRPDRLVSRYVGQTGEQVGALFDLAARGVDMGGPEPAPILLFLDEFETLAGQRRGARQAADDERNAYVNVLLQRVEQYKGPLIAATNYRDRVDEAMWRRFDIQITLQLPGQFERERILERYLAPFGLPEPALAELAEAFATASPALMRGFCEDVKRQIVIGPLLGEDMAKAAVVERVLASRQPHADAGKPRLWSHKAGDRAIDLMPWPLPTAADAREMGMAPILARDPADNVVSLPRRP